MGYMMACYVNRFAIRFLILRKGYCITHDHIPHFFQLMTLRLPYRRPGGNRDADHAISMRIDIVHPSPNNATLI